MPRVIALTSNKGGVGKSTLAMHLAGALAEGGGRAVLIDEDERIASCVAWARRGPGLGFEVFTPSTTRPKKLQAAHHLVIDTEGRPKFKDVLKLLKWVDRLLVPTGTSRLEVEATVALYEALEAAGAELGRVSAVITKAPPVGGAALTTRDALREAGMPVASTVVRAYSAYGRAAEDGRLVRDLPGDSARQAWQDVRRLAREVG